MIELLVIAYIILTVITGFNEAKYLAAQSSYWDRVPLGDYEFYESPGEIKHSLCVWIVPLAIPICYLILRIKK